MFSYWFISCATLLLFLPLNDKLFFFQPVNFILLYFLSNLFVIYFKSSMLKKETPALPLADGERPALPLADAERPTLPLADTETPNLSLADRVRFYGACAVPDPPARTRAPQTGWGCEARRYCCTIFEKNWRLGERNFAGFFGKC